MSRRMYGGFYETPLREAGAGAARGTWQRAIYDLFGEVDELREALTLLSHRVPWDDHERCWCAVAPFDDGTTKAWRHDTRCCEIKVLLDEN